MSGMSIADPHNDDGAFGAGVEVGSLRVGWVVAVGRGEDVGRGVLDNVGVVGRRVFVGGGVLV